MCSITYYWPLTFECMKTLVYYNTPNFVAMTFYNWVHEENLLLAHTQFCYHDNYVNCGYIFTGTNWNYPSLLLWYPCDLHFYQPVNQFCDVLIELTTLGLRVSILSLAPLRELQKIWQKDWAISLQIGIDEKKKWRPHSGNHCHSIIHHFGCMTRFESLILL